MLYNKSDVIYSDGIGVCEVSDIVNLSVNQKPPIQYYLLTSVYDKKKISYIPVMGHQVLLRPLISAAEAKEKEKHDHITEAEKGEINYVLGRSVS